MFLFGMDRRGGFFRFIFFKSIRKVACKFFDSFLREEIVDSFLRRINLFPSFNFHCKKKKKFKRRSYFSDREGKENFFSCSNLKYEVLQVCFEIKKKRFFDRNTRISLHFNKLQFLGEMYFTLRMKKEKEKKKGERKKKLSKKKKRSSKEYWVEAGIRN